MYCRKLEFCRAAGSITNHAVGCPHLLTGACLWGWVLWKGPRGSWSQKINQQIGWKDYFPKKIHARLDPVIGTLPFSNATRPLKMAGRLSHFLAFCQWLTLEFRGVQVGHVCSLKPRNWTLCAVSQFHFEFADHDSSFWTAYIAVVCEGRQALEWKCL